MAATAVVQPATHHSPYHFGEQSVQSRVGTRSISERVGKFIRSYLTDQARDFFEDLPLWFIGARSQDGSVWATTLCGLPGFIKAIDDHHFAVDLKQMYGDEVTLKEGDPIGSVGIMLHNRRRNRLNCIVESRQPGSIIVRVTQSFGNCPKYIQVRNIVVDSKQLASLGTEERPVTRGGSVLGPDQRALIARCDMLFLATSFMGISEGEDGMNGCDCNDRGGAPGFVQVSGVGTLRWGDYIGNDMFMSLGNIVADPRCGIQFIDFATGDSLQLTGRAKILFDERSLPGAQRTIEFTTIRWVHITRGLPISTKGAVEMSPYLPLDNGKAASITGLKTLSIKEETHDVKTFGFNAPRRPDGSPFCEAGQFASFDFPRPNGETLNRTWTISSPPSEIAETGRFTISVKKAGVVSTYLHEEVGEMSELVFRGVDGDFTLDRAAKCIPPAGVLLVAGGIGVTPIRAMLAVCVQRGYPVTLIYTVRRAGDAAFLSEFKETAAAHDNVQLALILTGQGEQPVDGVATFLGRLKAALIKQVCPDVTEREIFQCGPDTMMNSVVAELKGLGVPQVNIHQENFNF